MPDFPGISEAEVPSDWDAGLPMDMDRIRDKDEDYWEAHRGTPKVFMSSEAGLNIWSTQWGDYTALRIPANEEDNLTPQILAALRPEMNQLIVQDFRSQAQASASSAVDFGGLFIGMSFFLILAALGLVAIRSAYYPFWKRSGPVRHPPRRSYSMQILPPLPLVSSATCLYLWLPCGIRCDDKLNARFPSG